MRARYGPPFFYLLGGWQVLATAAGLAVGLPISGLTSFALAGGSACPVCARTAFACIWRAIAACSTGFFAPNASWAALA